jgi:hypothetical protein
MLKKHISMYEKKDIELLTFQDIDFEDGGPFRSGVEVDQKHGFFCYGRAYEIPEGLNTNGFKDIYFILKESGLIVGAISNYSAAELNLSSLTSEAFARSYSLGEKEYAEGSKVYFRCSVYDKENKEVATLMTLETKSNSRDVVVLFHAEKKVIILRAYLESLYYLRAENSTGEKNV